MTRNEELQAIQYGAEMHIREKMARFLNEARHVSEVTDVWPPYGSAKRLDLRVIRDNLRDWLGIAERTLEISGGEKIS